jgi:hypothetical protein
MREKIEKVLELLAEIRQERLEAFLDCNAEELEDDEELECEEVENIDMCINMLEELL